MTEQELLSAASAILQRKAKTRSGRKLRPKWKCIYCGAIYATSKVNRHKCTKDPFRKGSTT